MASAESARLGTACTWCSHLHPVQGALNRPHTSDKNYTVCGVVSLTLTHTCKYRVLRTEDAYGIDVERNFSWQCTEHTDARKIWSAYVLHAHSFPNIGVDMTCRDPLLCDERVRWTIAAIAHSNASSTAQRLCEGKNERWSVSITRNAKPEIINS